MDLTVTPIEIRPFQLDVLVLELFLVVPEPCGLVKGTINEDITPSDVPAGPSTIMQGPMTSSNASTQFRGELVLKRSFSYF